MKQENIRTFLDGSERTIIGEVLPELCTDELYVIKNPVVVNIIPQMDQRTGQPTGQMALQLLPLFFKEFQGDKSEPVIFEYKETAVTKIKPFDGGFDFRLYAQYEQIFNPSNLVLPENSGQVVPAGAPQQEPVKLFDD